MSDPKYPTFMEIKAAQQILAARHSKPPVITIELSNCPTHGAVDADHRCPQFDGVLRDAWTGEVLPDPPKEKTCSANKLSSG
jgi:hypothetical protein